ncbi:glycosyltransferase [Ornithinimicrobium sp. Y1847]|uniref:glycosyltransferase n=1 Tax=unclassified Ornithinimicrobium TaxID=2615080 RepID=UPI003B676DE0
MRVLAVTTWLPTPSHPSMGSFVVKDAHAIASLGHEVLLAHLVPPHQGRVAGDAEVGDGLARFDEIEGLPVVRIPMSTSRPDHIVRARRALQGLVRQADLLHTMAFSSLLPFPSMLPLPGARPDLPWVHTDHWSGLTTPESLPRAWQVALPALLPLLQGPDVATAVVERLARPIREVRGDRPTVVVPCVVPAPPGGPQPRPADDLNPNHNHTLNLVGVGGLVEGKDPLLAVDVVAELHARGTPATLRLVGDGPLRADIRRRARERGVADDLTLVGTLDRTGVLAELARADLFLGPTRSDNFYVSAAEAIISGRPVVAGANGGHAEYLDPRVSRLVPVQEASAYADAVQDLVAATAHLSANDIAATLGHRFEPEQVAQGYQQAYNQAAELRAQTTHRRRRG